MRASRAEQEKRRAEIMHRLDILGVKYPRCGFSVGPGWVPIVFMALEKMKAAGWDCELGQVKEKFGGLRIYTDGIQSLEITDIIHEAEAIAAQTCEDCGGPGVLNGGSWLRTVCAECGAANRASVVQK